jgi:uncharacterized protein
MFGEIRNPQGELLDYTFAESEGGGDQIVVIGPGVTANKDRDWVITLSNALNAAGVASLRFSFSGNGDSEGDFRDSCPTKEVADLGAVLDALAASDRDWAIAYAGHSMGGAVGVQRAFIDARIEMLISLAGMVDTADFAKRKFGELTPGVGCMWDKPECPLSQAFLDDMNLIGSVEKLAEQVQVPWLLVHGTGDTVVPPEESERMAARGADTELITLEGADHIFSGDAAALMSEAVVEWLTDPS